MSPLTLLTLLLLARPAFPLGLSCPDHPAHHRALTPVLLQSWTFTPLDAYMSHYHPRHLAHVFAPRDAPASAKYRGLDLFWATTGRAATPHYASLNLHRPAKLYLLVQFEMNRNQYPPASLPGWRAEGHASLVEGRDAPLKYGVHRPAERFIPMQVYVFSRVFARTAILPHQKWVQMNTKGIRARGDYIVLLAEADGSPSKPPQSPPGIRPIIPNQRCPDALHALWVTPDDDPNDPDTRGKMWQTHHPAWDPCYFCAYDHEHGSDALSIMGYAPKYDYTAWKNGREAEANEGFKSAVFRAGKYFVYWSVHVQTSSLRRVYEPNHTITLVVVDARTKEKLVEINHKGDFGFLAARANPTGFFPLSVNDRSLMDEQYEEKTVPRRRTVNVINVHKLDSRFSYQPKDRLLIGEYEGWTTGPLCSTGSPYSGGITFDITAPCTGIKSIMEQNVKVLLGSYKYGQFFRSNGAKRVVQVNNFQISDDACMFKLENIHGARSPSGYFYTDAYAKELMGGPGPKSVRQFMKPGFKISVSGRFEAVDSWQGIFKDGHLGFVHDFGYGIDPDKN